MYITSILTLKETEREEGGVRLAVITFFLARLISPTKHT